MEKPRLSFWQIWNMSFGFLGIQFGWTLQMNNISAIYEYLGAQAQPVADPVLGGAPHGPSSAAHYRKLERQHLDETGPPAAIFPDRGDPQFLALILMPMSGALWMAAGTLWILDASINISMEPFRAFVADMLPDDQRARGFTMQSFFIGVGSVGASYIPWVITRLFPSSSIAAAHTIPPVVRFSFWIGAVAFISAVLWTVFTTKEYPPTLQERERLKTAKAFDLAEIGKALVEMPRPMRQLALVQFLTWVGLFCLFLYFGVAVARNVFGAQSPSDPAYTTGIIWAGYCSGFYNVVCFIVSPMLPSVVRRIGKRATHSVCLLAGALGLISIAFIHDQWLLFAPMLGVGVAWASILSMPYSILSASIPQNRDGSLHGYFQFLHRFARNSLVARLWLDYESPAGKQSNERFDCRRSLLHNGGNFDAAHSGIPCEG